MSPICNQLQFYYLIDGNKCEVLNSNNEIVHTCYRNNGLYTTRDLSWIGFDLSSATNLIGLKQNRAKQIHAYVADVAKHALIIHSEIIQHAQNSHLTPQDLNLIQQAYLTKSEAVYKLHASLGHLLYSRIERMILKGIMKGYTFDLKLLKQLLNTKCDICLRAKITDAGHKGYLFHSNEPWHTFSFDNTGPFRQRSLHGNFYMGAIMDTNQICQMMKRLS